MLRFALVLSVLSLLVVALVSCGQKEQPAPTPTTKTAKIVGPALYRADAAVNRNCQAGPGEELSKSQVKETLRRCQGQKLLVVEVKKDHYYLLAGRPAINLESAITLTNLDESNDRKLKVYLNRSGGKSLARLSGSDYLVVLPRQGKMVSAELVARGRSGQNPLLLSTNSSAAAQRFLGY